VTLSDLEKKYYLCQPLTKKEWQELAIYWGQKLKTLEGVIKQRYAILKEQNICVDCFKDVPALSSLVTEKIGEK
jgi:hypothetical protein